MILEDLLFTPFGVYCPECRFTVRVTFEDLQFNEKITCLECGNIFSPDKDAESLLETIRRIEGTDVEKLQEEKRRRWLKDDKKRESD